MRFQVKYTRRIQIRNFIHKRISRCIYPPKEPTITRTKKKKLKQKYQSLQHPESNLVLLKHQDSILTRQREAKTSLKVIKKVPSRDRQKGAHRVNLIRKHLGLNQKEISGNFHSKN